MTKQILSLIRSIILTALDHDDSISLRKILAAVEDELKLIE